MDVFNDAKKLAGIFLIQSRQRHGMGHTLTRALQILREFCTRFLVLLLQRWIKLDISALKLAFDRKCRYESLGLDMPLQCIFEQSVDDGIRYRIGN